MNSIRTLKLRHDFTYRDGALALGAAFAVAVLGPWALLAAVLVLVATGNLTFTLEIPTAPQEPTEATPTKRPCDECGAPISDLCPLVEHAPACSLHPSALVA